jgi:hypothetical protein
MKLRCQVLFQGVHFAKLVILSVLTPYRNGSQLPLLHKGDALCPQINKRLAGAENDGNVNRSGPFQMGYWRDEFQLEWRNFMRKLRRLI